MHEFLILKQVLKYWCQQSFTSVGVFARESKAKTIYFTSIASSYYHIPVQQKFDILQIFQPIAQLFTSHQSIFGWNRSS